MAKPPRLSDLQLIIMSHAAKNYTGCVHPLLKTASQDTARVETELKSLLRRGLLTQAPTSSAASTWHTRDDERIGLFLTDKKRAALGIEVEDDGDAGGTVDRAPVDQEPAPPPAVRSNKQADVLALMHRADGATVAEIMDATGWLAHSTRAVLTGLRKKGHAIERGKRGEVTCYRLVEAA